jgi:phosphoketolase
MKAMQNLNGWLECCVHTGSYGCTVSYDNYCFIIKSM